MEIIWRKTADGLTPYAVRIKDKPPIEMHVTASEFRAIRSFCICFGISFKEESE